MILRLEKVNDSSERLKLQASQPFPFAMGIENKVNLQRSSTNKYINLEKYENCHNNNFRGNNHVRRLNTYLFHYSVLFLHLLLDS